MKKVIILALAAFSVNAYAQSTIQLKHIEANATLAPNATVVVTTTASSNSKINVDIKNTSSTTQSYNVKRYDVLLNTDATAYFCFGGSCYSDATVLSPNPLTLTGGTSASQIAGTYNNLTADLDEGAVAGYSLVKYTFINTANSSDSVQISVKYNAAVPTNTVGIKENTKTVSSFEIFPNPAKETTSIRITSPKAFESSLVLFNSLGEVVYQKALSITEGKNKVDINVDNLPAGVYFASIKSGDSTISKKLIIN